MAEYIECRNCESPDCKGCNLKNLETMLNNGKFDCLMNGNRCVNTSSDVQNVRNGRWIKDGVYWRCIQCGRSFHYRAEPQWWNYCPQCGAMMDK